MASKPFAISAFVWLVGLLAVGDAAGYAIGMRLTHNPLAALLIAFVTACLAIFGVVLIAPGGRRDAPNRATIL